MYLISRGRKRLYEAQLVLSSCQWIALVSDGRRRRQIASHGHLRFSPTAKSAAESTSVLLALIPFVRPLSNYAIGPLCPSPDLSARIIQNLMKFDEPRASTSPVHLSPPVVTGRPRACLPHLPVGQRSGIRPHVQTSVGGACALRSCGAEVMTTGAAAEHAGLAGGVEVAGATPALPPAGAPTSCGWLASQMSRFEHVTSIASVFTL